MAFKSIAAQGSCPEDPEALLRDLRRKTIPGLLSHQADILRSYLSVHTNQSDVALQLPTGSGKTLVGLLIGEWRRRKYGERVVYLCPTNQLVNQVAHHARNQYGLDVHAFTGSKEKYPARAVADWQSAEAIGITNYSSLFNVNPFFCDPHLIILDDAHSAENYIADHWSLLIERTRKGHDAAFSALTGIIKPLLPPADRNRFAVGAKSDDRAWVEKIPTPVLKRIIPEITGLLDEHTKTTELKFPWQTLRSSLHACHMYVSETGILIRPLIPPTNTHAPFASAKQRIYMSATLGAGGDLERITGRAPIYRIPVPSGWDKQGIGRRFFIFPKRSLDDKDSFSFLMNAINIGGRALYLVPDIRSGDHVAQTIRTTLKVPIFDASQIEESKQPFVSSKQAVAVVANRYDGIDLVGDDCRLLIVDGLPGGANLQERFLVLRVTAQLLLDDRILTRLVQGFGRCTRSPNDFAAVIILSEPLNSYLFASERREFFHPEIQAEMEFGLRQSKDASEGDLLEYLKHFLAQDSDWDQAHKDIVSLRAGLKQKTLAATTELATVVGPELEYQYALWNGDFTKALDRCRAVLGRLSHNDLRGYRALWLYLAGSSAWLAHSAGQLTSDDVAKDYFRQAQAAAPVLRWLIGLQAIETASDNRPIEDAQALSLIERLELVLEELGTVHDRKYDAEEAQVLNDILQSDDGIHFELGQVGLGRLLGFKSARSTDNGAPDPWWIVDDSLCVVFEDHAEGKGISPLSVTKARQAASHPEWIRSNLQLTENAEIISVIITPCLTADKGAFPHLKTIRYWNLDEFRVWAKNALQVVREIRREFRGPGNLDWRTMAVQRFRTAGIAPNELKSMLNQSGADAMKPEGD